jgi:uncharacterized HhH-GPD family protein
MTVRAHQGHAAQVVLLQPASVDRAQTRLSRADAGSLHQKQVRREPFVVGALLEFGQAIERSGESRLAPTQHAEQLVRQNPFAFLIAVLLDQGVPAERAFQAPVVLEERLGTLHPVDLLANRKAVCKAMKVRPMPFRFPATGAIWIIEAAKRVVAQYGGDARSIWSDSPSAIELQRRLQEFDGIGQKKAAMTVEILVRDFECEILDLSGSDVAVDVHTRRVFTRLGLVDRDDTRTIVDAARRAHPKRPGELDVPAWIIGRQWCRPRNPACGSCPLSWVCPTAADDDRSSS